jgi:uncharacterized membrane protein YeaQ/YmgE (transglycosylase-associated protein family)
MFYPRENSVMAEHSLLMWLVIGALAGWLAGLVVKGSGYGLFIDLLIGVLGACLGGWLAHVLGIGLGGGFVTTLVVATLGAVLLLVLVRVFKQAMR